MSLWVPLLLAMLFDMNNAVVDQRYAIYTYTTPLADANQNQVYPLDMCVTYMINYPNTEVKARFTCNDANNELTVTSYTDSACTVGETVVANYSFSASDGEIGEFNCVGEDLYMTAQSYVGDPSCRSSFTTMTSATDICYEFKENSTYYAMNECDPYTSGIQNLYLDSNCSTDAVQAVFTHTPDCGECCSTTMGQTTVSIYSRLTVCAAFNETFMPTTEPTWRPSADPTPATPAPTEDANATDYNPRYAIYLYDAPIASEDHNLAFPLDLCVTNKLTVEINAGVTTIEHKAMFTCNDAGDELTVTSYTDDACTTGANVEDTFDDTSLTTGETGQFNCIGDDMYVTTRSFQYDEDANCSIYGDYTQTSLVIDVCHKYLDASHLYSMGVCTDLGGGQAKYNDAACTDKAEDTYTYEPSCQYCCEKNGVHVSNRMITCKMADDTLAPTRPTSAPVTKEPTKASDAVRYLFGHVLFVVVGAVLYNN